MIMITGRIFPDSLGNDRKDLKNRSRARAMMKTMMKKYYDNNADIPGQPREYDDNVYSGIMFSTSVTRNAIKMIISTMTTIITIVPHREVNDDIGELKNNVQK